MISKIKRQDFDSQFIRLIATRLILARGCATAPWVGSRLRALGLRVSRAETARWLAAVARQYGWSHLDNGRLRLYYFTSYAPSLN